MKVFKVLLVKNRKLYSATSLGKRIRYSTKRVNVPPKGYDQHLYSFTTLNMAVAFMNGCTAFGNNYINSTYGIKYVVYEAIAITKVDSDTNILLSRKLKLVKRIK